MLRLACCMATERGIEVCAPIHDAVLICAPLDRLDADIAAMRSIMAEASQIALGGFELATDVHVTRYRIGSAIPAAVAMSCGNRYWRSSASGKRQLRHEH
jgi:hypothetical protein